MADENNYVSKFPSMVAPAIGILTVILNATKLYFLAKKMRKKIISPLVYSGSLSVADLIVGAGVFVVLYRDKIKSAALNLNEMETKEKCDVLKFALVRWAIISTCFHLVFILLDRVWGVHKLIGYVTFSIRMAIFISVILLIIPAVLVGILVVIDRMREDVDGEDELIFPIILVILCIIFLCSVTYIYWRVKVNIQRRKTEHPTQTENDIEEENKSKVYNKMTLYKILAFFVCWTPYAIVKILKALNLPYGSKTSENICFTIAISSSLINPILFIYYTKDEPINKKDLSKIEVTSNEITSSDEENSICDYQKKGSFKLTRVQKKQPFQTIYDSPKDNEHFQLTSSDESEKMISSDKSASPQENYDSKINLKNHAFKYKKIDNLKRVDNFSSKNFHGFRELIQKLRQISSPSTPSENSLPLQSM